MEQTTQINGRDYTYRGLTWGEKKDLKNRGYDLMKLDPDADNDEKVETVVEMASPKTDLSAMPVRDVYTLFSEIMKATFGTEEAAKN